MSKPNKDPATRRPRGRGPLEATATLAAAALIAKTIAGGSHETTKYDADTEAQMQHAMRPTMVRMARKALKASKHDEVPGVNVHKGLTKDGKFKLDLRAVEGGIKSHVQVVMGPNGTGTPDPRDVESIQTYIDTGNDATGIDRQVLAAPGADVDAHVPVPMHVDGWSAAEVNRSRANASPYYYLNTSEADHTLAALHHNPPVVGNPVATARVVVRDARQDFALGITPFVTGNPYPPAQLEQVNRIDLV